MTGGRGVLPGRFQRRLPLPATFHTRLERIPLVAEDQKAAVHHWKSGVEQLPPVEHEGRTITALGWLKRGSYVGSITRSTNT